VRETTALTSGYEVRPFHGVSTSIKRCCVTGVLHNEKIVFKYDSLCHRSVHIHYEGGYPAIQFVPRALFLGVMLQKREVKH